MPRPNFLIFMPDQLRADCVGCFGNPVVRTPNIDGLARRGTRFANAYINHPVCSPSRATLMTGWYPHTAGHRTLTHLIQPHEPNLLRYLKDGGYHVAWAGARGDMFAPGVTEASTHFSGWLTRPKQTQRGMGPQYPPGSALYHAFYHGKREGNETWLDFDEAATRTAEQWLAGHPNGPWCLFVPLIFPHLPFEVEEPWYSLHDAQDMPQPIAAGATRGKPRFMAALRDRFHLDQLSAGDWAEIARVYYGMIARVDSQLGRVLDSVDALGATATTNVLFFTDHGEYLGDYGLVEKWPAGLDDCITHNPLIFAGPDAAAGKVAESFVEMVDIMPTILELAGVPVRHSHFGRSFVPLLRDATTAHRDQAFTEGGFRAEDEPLLEQSTGEYQGKGELQHEQPRLVGKAIAMRISEWTYVYRQYETDELYDRNADPRETTNLLAGATADAPAHVVAARLRGEVMTWLLDTSDVFPWQPDPRFPKVPHGQHTAFPDTRHTEGQDP